MAEVDLAAFRTLARANGKGVPVTDVAEQGGTVRRPSHFALSVAAVAALAISQPVLGILGANPEFFIARSSPRGDALVVAVVVGLLVPALLALATYAAARANADAGVAVHGFLFGGLGGWTAAQVLDGLGVAGAVAVLAGVAIGVGIVVGYHRVEGLRWVTRWGAVIPGVVVLLFLFASPTTALILGTGEEVEVDTTTERPAPVVVMIVDELPTASLLADVDTINEQRFPNIASLAADGVWYRRTTTVAARSNHAVPAILSGTYPQRGMIPSWIDWPINLMTLLADSHEVHAREPVTGLCPPSVCDDSEPRGDQAAPDGLSSLLSDVRLIALHVTLPDAFTGGLPPVDQNWGNFGGGGTGGPASDIDDEVIQAEREQFQGLLDEAKYEVESGRADDFDDWVAEPGARPDLYVLHTLMPHKPWEYLPSGYRYADVPRIGVDEDGSELDDEWRRRFDERRHLLQVGMTDRMVGSVLDDLRTHGLYDEAMIVLVSDHGQAFVAGENGREPMGDNVAEILDVPLIVKYPSGSSAGTIDDRPAMIIDIVPTILEVLGVSGAPELDGTSLLGPADQQRQRRFFDYTEVTDPVWDPDGLERVVAERLAVYGPDPTWDAVWEYGPYDDLIGREVEVEDLSVGRFRVAYDREELLARVPGRGGFVPSLVAGGIAFDAPGFEELPFLAVVVNDRIVGIARMVERTTDDSGPFHALVPPSAFADRDNEIRILYIDEDADGITLLRASNE